MFMSDEWIRFATFRCTNTAQPPVTAHVSRSPSEFVKAVETQIKETVKSIFERLAATEKDVEVLKTKAGRSQEQLRRAQAELAELKGRLRELDKELLESKDAIKDITRNHVEQTKALWEQIEKLSTAVATLFTQRAQDEAIVRAVSDEVKAATATATTATHIAQDAMSEARDAADLSQANQNTINWSLGLAASATVGAGLALLANWRK